MATVVEEKEIGVRFEVPEGWKYKKLQTGYIFGHPALQGLLLLLFHYNKNLEEMQREMEAGFYDDSGFNLQVKDSVREISDTTLLAEYEGMAQGQPALGYSLSVLSPFGGGVLVAAIASPENFGDEYMDFVEDIVRSLDFFEPENASVSEEWQGFLNNKILDNRDGSNARAKKIKYHLHDNGTFTAFGDDTKNELIAAYEAAGGNTSGQWEVVEVMEQAILSLTYFNGTEKQYTLNYENGEIFLNNEHWEMQDITS